MKAKKVLLTILSVFMYTGMILADGENPTHGASNVVEISGQVVDQNTGETLAGVKLIVEGSNEVIYTDFDGKFEIKFDLDKKPELSVALISYEGKTVKIEGRDNLNIKLERQK
jgi:hypothetical protein